MRLACKVCSKPFDRSHSLRDHLRIHTGETPYECPTCKKGFAQVSNLRTHMRIHAGEKPFKCPSCEMAFTQSGTLKNHIRKHTRERPYTCKSCSRCFATSGNMEVHFKRCSGEIDRQQGEDSTCDGFDQSIENDGPWEIETERSCLKIRIRIGKERNEENLYGGVGDVGSTLVTNQVLSENGNGNPEGEETPSRSEHGNVEVKSESVKRKSRVRRSRTKKATTRQSLKGEDGGLSSPEKRRSQKEDQNTCNVCQKTWPSFYKLQRHMKTHTGEKPYQCQLCGKSFLQSHALKVHMATIHSNEKPFQCQTCGKAYKLSAHLRLHMSTAHGEKIHRCEKCEKSFAHVNLLRTHAKCHAGEKPYECTTCRKTFAQKSYLKTHTMIHAGDKPHVCPLCGKGFVTLNNLKTHVKRHGEMSGEEDNEANLGDRNQIDGNYGTNRLSEEEFRKKTPTHSKLRKLRRGERPYKCPTCNEEYQQWHRLRIHLRKHTGERPYVCEECGKAFTELSNLKIHKRIHTGEKPHVCHTCGKAFTELGNLQLHIRIHSAEKPFLCPHCSKGFAQLASLQIHTRSHTGEKPYKCRSCLRGFTTSGNRNTHAKKCRVQMVFDDRSTDEAQRAIPHDQVTMSRVETESALAAIQTVAKDFSGGAVVNFQQNENDVVWQKNYDNDEDDDDVEDSDLLQDEIQVDAAEVGSRWPDVGRSTPLQVCDPSLNAHERTPERSLPNVQRATGICDVAERERESAPSGTENLEICRFKADLETNGWRKDEEVAKDGVTTNDLRQFSLISANESVDVVDVKEEPDSFLIENEDESERADELEFKSFPVLEEVQISGGAEKLAKPKRKRIRGPQHYKRDRTIKRHICDVCGKPCTDISKLREHLRTHTGEKPYKCPLCDKHFSYLHRQQMHLKIHTGERPFVCEACGLTFGDASNLKNHQKRFHVEVKPFLCVHCGNRYAEACKLRKHLERNVPSGESLDCKYCDETFPRRCTLRAHVLVHNAEQRFKCEFCAKGFTRPHNRDMHEKTCSGQKTSNEALAPLATPNAERRRDENAPAISSETGERRATQAAQRFEISGAMMRNEGRISEGTSQDVDKEQHRSNARRAGDINDAGDNSFQSEPRNMTKENNNTSDNRDEYMTTDARRFPSSHDEGGRLPNLGNSIRENILTKLRPVTNPLGRLVICITCGQSYPTSKALKEHQRIDHITKTSARSKKKSKKKSSKKSKSCKDDSEGNVAADDEEGKSSLSKSFEEDSVTNGTPGRKRNKSTKSRRPKEGESGKNVVATERGKKRSSKSKKSKSKKSKSGAGSRKSESSSSCSTEIRGRKIHPCYDCGKLFSHPCDLRVHMRIHLGDKPYECPVCQKGFTQESNMKTHLRIHTGDKPFKCQSCEKLFTQYGNLETHTKKHTGEKPFKCQSCSLAYTTLSNLEIHIRKRHGDEVYVKVELPEKTEKYRKKAPSLSNRRKDETEILEDGEKLYKCPTCDKEFLHPSGMKTHMRVHTGEKPYVCQWCGKGFAGLSHLTAHSTIHTGEKPYVCETCGRTFSQLALLKMHRRIHTGVKSYRCAYCSMRFSQKNGLTVHTRSHTGERPYDCQTCSKRFATAYSMKKHAQLQHGRVMLPGRVLRREEEAPSTAANETAESNFGRKEWKKSHLKRYLEDDANTTKTGKGNAEISNEDLISQRNDDDDVDVKIETFQIDSGNERL